MPQKGQSCAGGARAHRSASRASRMQRVGGASNSKGKKTQKRASTPKKRASTPKKRASTPKKRASKSTPRPIPSDGNDINVKDRIKDARRRAVSMSMQLTVIQGIADSLGIPFDGVPKETLVRKINEKISSQ